MQNLERWYPLLLAILLCIVAVMVFAEYGEDGAVVFGADGESTAIVVIGAVAIAGIVGETIRNKNLTASYERLSTYLSNPIIIDELAEHYQSLPPLPKKATDILIDIAGAVADLSETDADNEIIDRLREALDSKEKSLEPSGNPGDIRQ